MAEMSRSVATANAKAQNAKEITTTVQESLQTCQLGIGNIQTELKRHLKMIQTMSRNMDQLRREKHQIQEKLTDLQYRSLKMKLVFKGLGGESRNEDTIYKIRQFLSK